MKNCKINLVSTELSKAVELGQSLPVIRASEKENGFAYIKNKITNTTIFKITATL